MYLVVDINSNFYWEIISMDMRTKSLYIFIIYLRIILKITLFAIALKEYHYDVSFLFLR